MKSNTEAERSLENFLAKNRREYALNAGRTSSYVRMMLVEA
jgi:hypothetical protein